MLITNCFLAVAKINTNQQAATQIKPFLFVNSNLFFLVQSCLTSITYSEILDGSFASLVTKKTLTSVSGVIESGYVMSNSFHDRFSYF